MDAHLTAIPVGTSIGLHHLDAALATVRQAERDISAMATYLAEAREAVVGRPGDPEAVRRVTMSVLRMRGDALALAQDLAALARPEA